MAMALLDHMLLRVALQHVLYALQSRVQSVGACDAEVCAQSAQTVAVPVLLPFSVFSAGCRVLSIPD